MSGTPITSVTDDLKISSLGFGFGVQGLGFSGVVWAYGLIPSSNVRPQTRVYPIMGSFGPVG